MAPTWCAAFATRSSIWTSRASWRRSPRLEQVEQSLSPSPPAAASELEARAVILATGADAVRLAVPGADRFFLRGVAYSTVSYAPLYIDKTVALVGAGSMALRGAGELAQIVKQLYLVAPTHGELDTPSGPPAAGRRARDPAGELGAGRRRRRQRSPASWWSRSPARRAAHARCGRDLRRAGPEAALRAGAGLGRTGSRAAGRGQLRRRDQRRRASSPPAT